MSKLSKEERKEYFQGHWTFNGEKQVGHEAMSPEELPRRLIKMFSFVEDIVLDPFLGSGTTVLQASTRVPQKVFTVFSSGEKGEKKLHNPQSERK
jgi:DNA modification methylase